MAEAHQATLQKKYTACPGLGNKPHQTKQKGKVPRAIRGRSDGRKEVSKRAEQGKGPKPQTGDHSAAHHMQHKPSSVHSQNATPSLGWCIAKPPQGRNASVAPWSPLKGGTFCPAKQRDFPQSRVREGHWPLRGCALKGVGAVAAMAQSSWAVA